ncbi:aldo/keto reductase [Xylariales sp. PMI_506]|nr:aldo/keto reductase [Xylariales sp. PMI_506]
MPPKPLPSFIYGTAWKRDDTAVVVSLAIQNGFTAFDTAAQPKHYREELVGQAIREAFASGTFKSREDIWIQTKFSRPASQDPENSAYQLDIPLERQVHASIKGSLHNLRHDEGKELGYIDSLLLHSPYPDFADTLRAWRVLEGYVKAGEIRALGVSNVPLDVLTELYERADIKPRFVQVRFQPTTDYEASLRRFCAEREITFQAYRVLKANKDLQDSNVVGDVAAAVAVERTAALYLCVLGLSAGAVRILNGTKSPEHMRNDIAAAEKFQNWIREPGNDNSWESYMARFKQLVGE